MTRAYWVWTVYFAVTPLPSSQCLCEGERENREEEETDHDTVPYHRVRLLRLSSAVRDGDPLFAEDARPPKLIG